MADQVITEAGSIRWRSPEELVEIGFSRSRLVMMNEAHNGWLRCVRTRRIGTRILPVAHAAAVRHLAMEALFDPKVVEAANGSRRLPNVPDPSYLAQPELRVFIQTAPDRNEPPQYRSMRVISLRSSLGTHTVCEVVSRAGSSPTVLGNDRTGIDTSISSVSGSRRENALGEGGALDLEHGASFARLLSDVGIAVAGREHDRDERRRESRHGRHATRAAVHTATAAPARVRPPGNRFASARTNLPGLSSPSRLLEVTDLKGIRDGAIIEPSRVCESWR